MVVVGAPPGGWVAEDPQGRERVVDLVVEERLVEPEVDGARLMTFLNQG